MPLYFNGKLVAVGQNSFIGDKGEQVTYFINTLAHMSGVLTVNSKKDFSQFLNKDSTITVRIQPDQQTPKLYKISLLDIKPLPSSGETDETIE